jgi:hypothetical protein
LDRRTVSASPGTDLPEVDFVLENPAGQIVGIEVKAAASVTQRDFGGLRIFARSRCQRCGPDRPKPAADGPQINAEERTLGDMTPEKIRIRVEYEIDQLA